MCQTTFYFWVSFPGGEREEEGAWQAEGQTWCSAEWVSAAGPCSCCGLNIILVHWLGLSHQPGVLVLHLFIKQKKAESNSTVGQTAMENTVWPNWTVVALKVAKYFPFDKIIVFSYPVTATHFSLLNCIAPCILMSISSWSQLLKFSVIWDSTEPTDIIREANAGL